MKRFYSILVAMFISLATFAQDAAPKIVFEKANHEYGNIKEADGDASIYKRG